MTHYRLGHSLGLPFPALAIPAADLAAVGGAGPLGMELWTSLSTGSVPIPSIPISADLHVENEVTLYLTQIVREPGALVNDQFPDQHGAWADEIHAHQQMLLVASVRDLHSYPDMRQFERESWVGRISLLLRATIDGVGTRSG